MGPIIGNERAKRYLERMVHAGRLGQTLLFAGPSGVGKSLFARKLAKAVLCRSDAGAQAKFDHGSHPDFHLYQPQGRAALHSIETVRALSKEVFLPPLEAPRKVFIIEKADRMVSFSANALLKTFEEPSVDSLIILVTSHLDRLLPTIRSRCRMVHFEPIATPLIERYLIDHQGRDKKSATRLAVQARGSLQRALALSLGEEDLLRERLVALLSKGTPLAYLDIRQAAEEIASQLDAMRTEHLRTSLETSTARYQELPAAMREALEKEVEGAATDAFQLEIDRLFEELLFWFRDLHLLRDTGKTDHLFHQDHLTALIALEGGGDFPPLEKVEKAVQETRLGIARFSNLSAMLESLFLSLQPVAVAGPLR